MILTLLATGPHAATLGAAARHTFDRTGGTIGRASGNEWVLAHPYVSGTHARITWQGGRFRIEDLRSSNGIFINSLEQRLPLGDQHVLEHGDTIYIDPFEIRVSIETGAEAQGPSAIAPLLDDPFAPPPPPAPIRRERPPTPVSDPAAGDAVDPLDLLGLGGPSGPPRRAPRASDLMGAPPIHDQYSPPTPPAAQSPEPVPASPLIPEDYNPLLADDPFERAPASTPPARPAAGDPESGVSGPAPPHVAAGVTAGAGLDTPEAGGGAGAPAGRDVPRRGAPGRRARQTPDAAPPPQSAGADLARVLAGAGLDPAAVTPELAENFGRILRVVVTGVMEVLHARQQIKDEFGMRQTTFRPADNNPLKFSANLEDALHNLLVKRNAAYLGPVDAFEDAFTDIRNHQMAMLAGMRQAFETMLAAFNPARLEGEFDRHLKKGALLSVPGKLRYWDLYRERFDDMVRDPEATFSDLFGDEFARAYEEQLERLKTRTRGGGR